MAVGLSGHGLKLSPALGEIVSALRDSAPASCTLACWSFCSPEALTVRQELTDLGARIHGHTFMPLPGTPLRTAPPGRIDAATRRHLEVMTSDGVAYGKWRQQEKTAEQLVQLTLHRRNRQR